MTNKCLYGMLELAFPDVVAGFWKGYPYTKYSNKYILMKLNEIIVKLGTPNLSYDSYCLTQRQRYSALVVNVRCAETGNKLCGDALHYLADCVYNLSESEREILPTEHLLYFTLLNVIIQTVRR